MEEEAAITLSDKHGKAPDHDPVHPGMFHTVCGRKLDLKFLSYVSAAFSLIATLLVMGTCIYVATNSFPHLVKEANINYFIDEDKQEILHQFTTVYWFGVALCVVWFLTGLSLVYALIRNKPQLLMVFIIITLIIKTIFDLLEFTAKKYMITRRIDQFPPIMKGIMIIVVILIIILNASTLWCVSKYKGKAYKDPVNV